MDPSADPPRRDRRRAEAALWRAVRADDPHPVDPATLGEFAVLAHRAGLREATGVFPRVAEHLRLRPELIAQDRSSRERLAGEAHEACAVCGPLLHELLGFAESEWGPRRLRRSDSWPYEGAADTTQISFAAAAARAAPMMGPPPAANSIAASAAPYGRNTRSYEIGASTLTLRIGDITTSSAEVIVSSDGSRLSMGGGVSQAILRAAGADYRKEAEKVAASRRARVGDVLVTPAGRLPARYILHAITIGPGSGEVEPGAIVRHAVERVMRLVPLLGCRWVAFPSIGTGFAGISREVSAAEMGQALVTALRAAETPLIVELYFLDAVGWGGRPRRPGADEASAVFATFEAAIERTLGLQALPDEVDGALRLATPDEAAAHGLGAASTDEVRRRQGIVRLLRDLDARRSVLERALIEGVAAKEPGDEGHLAHIRHQLHELRALRENYEAELTGIAQPVAVTPRTVFLSSTKDDLLDYRARVRGVIDRLGYRFIGMEEFTAAPEAPAVLIRRRVEQSEIYVGVLGWRYGSVDESSGFSMTELEYRQAVASKKPIHMFVMDEKASINIGMVERDPESLRKLLDLRALVLKSHVAGMFTNPEELERKVEQTLRSTTG